MSKKLFLFFTVFLVALTSVSATYQYERGMGSRMNNGYQDQGFPYSPYGTSIAEDLTVQGYYDPVIFGPLGNAYYGGQFAYTYFPFTPGQAVNYYANGPFYRYEAPYRGAYGAGRGYGAGSYGNGFPLTGVPGFNAPANRIYGIGY